MDLVDTRVLGKPSNFHGRDGAEYRAFLFAFKAYMVVLNPRYADDFRVCEGQADRIEQPGVGEAARQRSEQLYYVLAMLVKDAAQVIVAQVDPGNGFEAFGGCQLRLIQGWACVVLLACRRSSAQSSQRAALARAYRIGC